MKTSVLVTGLLCLGGMLGAWQDPETKKKASRDKVDLVGPWIYDDVSAAFAQAKKTGKPMLVVFR